MCPDLCPDIFGHVSGYVHALLTGALAGGDQTSTQGQSANAAAAGETHV